MCNKKNYSLFFAITAFFAIFSYEQSIAMGTKPKARPVYRVEIPDILVIEKPTGPPQFCPQPQELIKYGDKWTTKDNKWHNFTHSSATEVSGFLGAQWVGVKIGKIICLYKTNEAVAFPLAIEQLQFQPTLEPSKYGWSALSKNRKFCKSTSVADCAYFPKSQKNISNVYKEITYNPRKD